MPRAAVDRPILGGNVTQWFGYSQRSSRPLVTLTADERDALHSIILTWLSGGLGRDIAAVPIDQLRGVLDAFEDTGNGAIEIEVLDRRVFKRVFASLAQYAADHPDQAESGLMRGACQQILAAVDGGAEGDAG